VAFASNSTPVCTVSASTISLVATGACSVTASQAGNGAFAPATPVTQTFSVVGHCTAAVREYIRFAGKVVAIEDSCSVP
jgi:hypothetical protein